MSFPSPLISAPGLSNSQLQFQSVIMGGTGTPFNLVSLEGLDKPDVRSGNTDRPRTRGAFVGLNLLKTRTITATFDIGPPFGTYTNLAGAVKALRTAISTEGTTEYPLWIQMANQPLVACMARVIKATAKWDVTADLGNLLRGVPIQFECSDPYLYSAPTSNPTVSLPTPGVGFTFPLTFNWSFGGGTLANQVTAVNNGDVPCWPVLVITGPCLNPSVSNTSIAGNPTLTLGQQLNTGDQLVIDCDQQSILFYPSGSTVGAPYPQILQPNSTFFALIPGSNVVSFNSQDVSPASGTLGLSFASAYDGLLV
jgi:hypothetical protein